MGLTSFVFFNHSAWRESIRLGDRSGRLLKYDPTTKEVTVLMRSLAFANGVALSKDNSFVLVGESGTSQIHKFWLRGPRAQTSELFAHLDKSPDNINRNERGEFWVAVGSGRQATVQAPSPQSLEGQVMDPWLSRDTVGIKFNEQGKMVKVLDGNGGNELSSISDIEERNGNLWIGSVVKNYVAVVQI